MRERLGLERQLTALRRSVEEPLWRELADPNATGAITPAAIGQNTDRITVATRIALGMAVSSLIGRGVTFPSGAYMRRPDN
jgi:hypothetical protein